MIRSTAFILLSTLAATPVLAQAPTDLSYAPSARGNVVGGGGASLAGGGEDMTITYSRGGAGGGASYEQLGRVASFAGTPGDGPYLTYGAPVATDPGRNAWLIGGGDNAQIVYVDPTVRRRR